MIQVLRTVDGKETVALSVADDNASVVGEIMGREEVSVDVTVDSPLDIRVGDHVRVDGVTYTLNREAGLEKRSAVEYRYGMVFESPLYRLLDKILVHPITGVSSFTISRTLGEWLKIVVDCVNTIDPGWTMAGIPETEPVNITFEGVSCREALTRLSDGFGMEFSLSGREIRFSGHVENATGLVFEQGKGKGLYTISQEPVDTGNTITRVFPYGGTTNMMPGTGDASGRLFLPEKYLENLAEHGKVVERVVAFDDVYPRFSGSADSVSGDYNRMITCAGIGFNITDWLIGGVTAKINFLSGDLMGESFGFNWDYAKKRIDLVRKEDGTAPADSDGKRPLIPHDQRKAEAGDRFNLTDIYMPPDYKTRAIEDLRTRATDYLAFYSRPRVKFALEVDHRFLRGKRVLRAGDLVTVKIPETATDKTLRVNSVERNLKTGRMSCVVSNYLDEKWEKKIEGELTYIKSSVSSDISDVRNEVSNMGRPSSLWTLDKQSEYLHLNDDGTIAILENDLEVKGDIKASGDVIAYSGSTIEQLYAKASVSNYGLVKIDGKTITINDEGQLVGASPGLDEAALASYLGKNSYITETTLSGKGYITAGYLTANSYVTASALTGLIKLTSPLTGYSKASSYTALTTSDTLLTAFGKLERNFDNYVNLTTDQTINGKKTFVRDVVSQGDVIAYSGSTIEQVYAKASATNYGLVKIDGVSITMNAAGQLVSGGGGGIGGMNVIGSGNVLSNVSLSSDKRTLTFTKDITAMTEGTLAAYLTTNSYAKKSDNVASATNADMLDNLHATDFTSFSRGGIDLNTVNKYIHQADSTGTANYPEASLGGNTFLVLSALPYNNASSTYASQLAFGFGSDYLAIRRKANSTTWSAWTKVKAGLADEATKLQNARTINGTNFDGTANIITNTWGTPRPFSIASSDMTGEGAQVSVNGFSSYVLPLPATIKAALNGNASTATLAAASTKLATARSLWGQTFDGTGNVSGNLDNVSTIYINNDASITFKDSGGAFRGSIKFNASNEFHLGYSVGTAGYSTFLSGNNIYFRYGTSGTIGLTLLSSGNFGIGTSSPSERLEVGGNIKASGNVMSQGEVIAYSGSTIEQVYAKASATSYGLVKIDGVSITMNAAGQLVSGGGGGIGGMNVIGSGNVLSNVSLSSDKRTLTFTKDITAMTEGTLAAYLLVNNYAKKSGNVASATKLQIARAINGTNFDGTAPITTALWGAARLLWGNPVNGSGDISGSLTTGGFFKSTIATGTAPIQVSSSTVCANLNAHYINGYSSNEIVKIGEAQSITGLKTFTARLKNTDWFENTVGGKGLYNSAQDSRWYASDGMWKGDKPLYIMGTSANGKSHLALANPNGYQWGIKSGHYMNSENSFSITCESLRNTSSFTITADDRVMVNGLSVGGYDERAYGLSCNEFLCNGWVRTNMGFFMQKGGGWIMMDTYWIRAYNRPVIIEPANPFGCSSFNVGLTVGGGDLSNMGLEICASDNVFGIGVHSNNNAYFWGTASGTVSSPTGKVYYGSVNLLNGSFNWTGTIYTDSYVNSNDCIARSDMRLKNFIREYTVDLNELSKIKLFEYTMRKDGDGPDAPKYIGSSAQQVRRFLPGCVYEGEGGYLSMSYQKAAYIMSLSLVKKVIPWMSEKDKKIIELENRITELENKLKAA